MHWRTRIFIAVLLVCTVAIGYFRLTYTPQQSLTVLPSPSPASEPELEVSPDDIVRTIAVPYTINGASPASQTAQLEFIQKYKPGMVVLFGSQVASDAAKLAVTQIKLAYTNAEYQPIIAVDHEGGVVQRLSGTGFTKLPSWQVLCHRERADRLQLLQTSAAELAAVGVNMIFAPVLDLSANNPAMGTRICSNDPTLTATAAVDVVNSFLLAGITSVVKHYPGIGTTTRDLHDSADVITGTREQSLFNAVLATSQNMGVMTAHVLVENVAEELPCSLSEECVYPLLIDHPEALVLADALEMNSARTEPTNPDQLRPLPEVAADALRAGNHVLLFGRDVSMSDLEEVVSTLKTRYTESVEFRSSVKAAVLQQEKVSRRYEK